MQTQEKQRVIKAINELGRKVSVADVATKTGLPLVVASSAINEVAAETKGHLQVSTAGDITYQFDFGFQNSYLAKGIHRFLERVGQNLFRVGFFLLRISFGIMLILSLILIVLIFFIIIQALSRGNNSDSDGDFAFDFFDYLILRDLIFWNYAYGPPYQSNRGRVEQTRNKGNFLYNCFSFLFGDGNPNAGLEEERWQLVARVIRDHGGVVTADELAPYTDADPRNEDGVLPVLVRFDGRPEVTDTGNIVYVFPALQVSAQGRESVAVPAFLREMPWTFTNLPADALTPVFILAMVNFVGSWFLFIPVLSKASLITLAPVLTVLVVYGTLFLLVPFLRWLTIQYLNARIETRNLRRHEWSQRIKEASGDLAKKLSESKQFRMKLKQLDASDVIYTTDKDLLEQEFDSEELTEKNKPVG